MVNIEDRSIWTQIVVNLPAPASEGPPATTSKPSTPTITELRASGGYIHVGWGKGPGTTDVDSFVIARVENGQHLNPRHAKEDQRSATFPAKAATYDIGVAAVNDVTKWPDLWNQEPVLSEFAWKRLVVGDDDQSLGVPLTGPFDSIATLPNGKTYATFGHLYVRYSDAGANRIDVGYPKPIAGNWGALPPAFFAGFDSMATLPDGKTYVTKGDQYVRYSDPDARFVDPTYPRRLAGNWGNLPREFESGFDSICTLSNGKTYITRGAQYLRYSDPSANKVDQGYPKPLNGNWGTLPAPFEGGFDAMVKLSNGKTYVTRGREYLRYSDPNVNSIDPGYPLPIAGNWGRANL